MKTKVIIPFLLVMLISCKKAAQSSDIKNPKLMISDITLPEGNSGTTNFEFNLTLDKPFAQTVTVTYSTLDGTAKSGEDFIAVTNQAVTFQPNETGKKITVAVIGDDLKESDEDFTITIVSAVNADIQKYTATAVISNDDTKIAFTNSGYDAPTGYPGYTLAWSDEFNSTTLDLSAWTFENGDGCPSLCGWGNNELEYYTNRPDNLFFQDGKMIIEARKELYGGKNYTSSKILTRDKKKFKYGRIDIRARLPKGKGIWPAFWLLPQSNVYGGWPKSGEIDLMELVGHEANKVYGTVHFGPGPGSTQVSRGYTLPAGLFNDEFHVFSVEWKQDQVKWLVDGNVYSTINKSDVGTNTYPFNEDFFFIINFAVGGNWPGNPDATTVFPQWLMVDYIRVYQ